MTKTAKRKSSKKKTLLHVGCGPKRMSDLSPFFETGWKELRYDIDPACKPDIQGDITDLSAVKTSDVDAVWSSHNIEHLFAHEAPKAIAEFRRVLRKNGFLVITCPDLKSVCRIAGQHGLDAVLYTSGMGPITPRDVLFGHQASIRAGGHFMAHRKGFDLKGLNRLLTRGGFTKVYGERKGYELWFIATDAAIGTDEARDKLDQIKPKRLEEA